jgi:rhamnosyltransferase
MPTQSSSPRTDLSVIILTKDGALHIGAVLKAVFQQDYEKAFEVIVIDSGSSDATLDIVEQYPVRLEHIPPSDFGHGRTRNLGASLARGSYLLYLPQDAVPVGSDCFSALESIFKSPRVAGGYCRQIPNPEASLMEQFFLAKTYSPTYAVRSLAGDVGELTLKGCFFSNVGSMIRTSVWEDIPFREDVIMSEDQAWAMEAMQAGYSVVYEPRAQVMHSHQYGIGEVFRRNFDSGYSIKQIFDGLTGHTLSENLQYLLKEMVFVCKGGRAFDMVRLPFYEAARFSGFWLGMHAESIPGSLRSHLGNLDYFWGEGSSGASV